MPCFKGLAVSIHTPDGPISEYSIQKQARASRISSYIPVPPAKVPADSQTGKPEQSTFAISITLLTPGLNVPYSTPKPTPDEPYPRPRVVGGLPGFLGERGKYGPPVPPYIPRTTNPNETIAAYIYFDGRAKEEVATLLRRGEETWVNSRWVSVPESEGGGLAEREFLFREVGLERWLNGLDLEGSNKEKAERIERRQRRLEKKRRIKKEQVDSDGEEEEGSSTRRVDRNGVLRYGGEGSSPVEDIAQDDGFFSSDSESDDEPPQPEAAGQIKVALFRVLASGEIKRGEYSPQFDAHDDDEGMDGKDANGDGGDVDHTTSFAKPKTLDPKTISTQTVTGLDPPESPYAVFTFFYRGDKQLRKMGILATPESEKTPLATKRRSVGTTDFSKLGPLKSTGTVGFSGYRDAGAAKRKNKITEGMDSDADDEDDERIPNGTDDAETKQEDGKLLSVEDARRQGELAEGVQKIKVSDGFTAYRYQPYSHLPQLKRQHSAEPVTESSSIRKSPHLKTEESPSATTPQSINSTSANAGTPPEGMSPMRGDPPPEIIGSPFKRHRASVPGLDSGILNAISSGANDIFPSSALAGGRKDDSFYAGSTPDEVKAQTRAESDEEL